MCIQTQAEPHPLASSPVIGARMMQFVQFYDPLNAITGPVSVLGVFCLWYMHCANSAPDTVYILCLSATHRDTQAYGDAYTVSD